MQKQSPDKARQADTTLPPQAAKESILAGLEGLLVQYEASGNDLGPTCIGADEAAQATLFWLFNAEGLHEAIGVIRQVGSQDHAGRPDLHYLCGSVLRLPPD